MILRTDKDKEEGKTNSTRSSIVSKSMEKQNRNGSQDGICAKNPTGQRARICKIDRKNPEPQVRSHPLKWTAHDVNEKRGS